MENSKQDTLCPRTAAQLEQKYNFGKTFAEIRGIALDAQTHVVRTERKLKDLSAKYADLSVEAENLSIKISQVDETAAELKMTADEQGAWIQSIATWQDETNKSIANIEQTVSAQSAEISSKASITDLEAQTTALAELTLRVDEHSSKILLTASNSDLNEAKQSITTLEQRVADDEAEIALKASISDLDEAKTSIAELTQRVTDDEAEIALRAMIADLDDMRLEVTAELSLRVEKDENDNLVGKIHIGADQLTIDTDNFKLLSDGTAYFAGEITASSGNIGGWNIINEPDKSNHCLKYFDSTKNLGTGFQPPNSGTWAISVGHTNPLDWSDGKFRVNHNGSVYCKSIDLIDEFTVTTSVGPLGVFTKTTSSLNEAISAICSAIDILNSRIVDMGM